MSIGTLIVQSALVLWQKAEGSGSTGSPIGQKEEGKRLTGQGFRIWLCPNRLGDCHNRNYT
ncbi:MAG: hypothetical protein LDL41_25515 [Coleofasciculus sp. S288]|nr:hypothetical protein [Coleofasciculus sp. S288]